MSSRVAIYFAPPPGGALWRFGSGVLGYDAASGADIPRLPGLPETGFDWPAWTEEPRVYGFHATLKAPFRLAAGTSLDEVEDIARGFAARTSPFRLPRLSVVLIGSFAALVPSAPCPALDDLAATCVETFEPVRAPLTEAEIARRMRAPLTPRQIALLGRYGYPHVLEQFRFHMTLATRLPPERAETARRCLDERYRSVEQGLGIDSICLFVQASPGERFTIRRRIEFTA